MSCFCVSHKAKIKIDHVEDSGNVSQYGVKLLKPSDSHDDKDVMLQLVTQYFKSEKRIDGWGQFYFTACLTFFSDQ